MMMGYNIEYRGCGTFNWLRWMAATAWVFVFFACGEVPEEWEKRSDDDSASQNEDGGTDDSRGTDDANSGSDGTVREIEGFVSADNNFEDRNRDWPDAGAFEGPPESDADSDTDSDADSDTDADTDVDADGDFEVPPLIPFISNYHEISDWFIRVKTNPVELYTAFCTGALWEQRQSAGAIEVVSKDADLNDGEPEAVVTISSLAQVVFSDTLAVVISPERECVREWIVTVYDFSNPLAPKQTGSLKTGEFGFREYWHFSGMRAYMDGDYRAYLAPNIRFLGNRLVMVDTSLTDDDPEENVEHCVIRPGEPVFESAEEMVEAPTIYGRRTCVDMEIGRKCTGHFDQCTTPMSCETAETAGKEGSACAVLPAECNTIASSEIETFEECERGTYVRTTGGYDFEFVDLSDPEAPVRTPTLSFSTYYEEDGVGLYAADSAIWVTYQRPVDITGDTRPYTQYYTKKMTLNQAGEPVFSEPQNLPGLPVHMSGDIWYTRDAVWTGERLDTAIRKLRIHDGEVTLLGSMVIEAREVHEIYVDEYERVYLTYGNIWEHAFDDNRHLMIIDTATSSFEVLSEQDVNAFNLAIRGVGGNRLVTSSGSGQMQVFDVADGRNIREVERFQSSRTSLVQRWDDGFVVVGGEHGLMRVPFQE